MSNSEELKWLDEIMGNNKRNCFLSFAMRNFLILLFLLLPLGLAHGEVSPSEYLKKKVDSLLGTLKSEASFEEKKSKVAKIFKASFNMVQLSGMALGREVWLSLKDEEKGLFVERYTEFLLSFYTSNMKDYKGEGLNMGEAILKSNGKKAEVPFIIVVEGKNVAMKYSLKKSKGNGWQIYDVEIEGVRLSTQYRNQFTSIIKKNGFKGLLSALDELILKQGKTAN